MIAAHLAVKITKPVNVILPVQHELNHNHSYESHTLLKLPNSKLRITIHNMVTWARAKFSWSSFREVAGKKTMLSIVWMSSSCTTHLISKPENNLSEPT
jgi:hypothetical protein